MSPALGDGKPFTFGMTIWSIHSHQPMRITSDTFDILFSGGVYYLHVIGTLRLGVPLMDFVSDEEGAKTSPIPRFNTPTGKRWKRLVKGLTADRNVWVTQ